jgi:trigger factor
VRRGPALIVSDPIGEPFPMQVTVQQLSPVLVEFQVEVPADRVKTEVDKAYAELQKTARVRGFRQGKAPRDVLSHVFGEKILVDVSQRLVNATLKEALADKKIDPISNPAIEPQKISSGASFSYKARFEVRPEIASVNYDGFQVKRPSIKVTPEALETELEKLRKAHATLVEPEPARPVQKGDMLTITFSLELGGKLVKDASAQNVPVEVGSGQLLSDLDDALVGMSQGDKKDVSTTFATNHARPDFRGKSGVFHVTVDAVKERRLPDLDDDFAKDVGAFKSLDELKKDLTHRIEKALKQQAEDAVAEQLVQQLNEQNPIVCPPSLVEQQCRAMEQEIAQQIRRQGLKPPPQQDLHARVHAESEMKVRAGLLMAEIAKSNQMRVSEEDIDKGMAELADQLGQQVAKLKAEYRDPKKREMLVGMILEDKILDIIESKAKITEA